MNDICPDSPTFGYPCDPVCARCGRLVDPDPALTAVAEAARIFHAAAAAATTTRARLLVDIPSRVHRRFQLGGPRAGSLRYASQRRNDLGSTHGLPGRDVPCRVQVGVARVSAADALEESLALATLPCDMLANRTTLTCVRGADLLDPSGGLVLEAADEHAPTGVEDRLVESGLLPDVAAGHLDGSAGRAGHVDDLEILDPDQVVVPSDIRAGLLSPVPASISVVGVDLGQASLRHLAPVRSALAPREGLSGLLDRQRRWRLVHRPVREGQGNDHAKIETHHQPIARPGGHFGDHREGDVPAPSTVQCDPKRLHRSQRAGAPELDPTNFWDVRPRPLVVQTLEVDVAAVVDAKSLVSALLPPCRPPMRPTPPEVQRLVEVAQGLLLDDARPSRKPVKLLARFGELATSLAGVWHSLSMMPIAHLLDSQIPYVSSVGAVHLHHLSLGWSGVHAEPAHDFILAGQAAFEAAREALDGDDRG